MLAQAAHCHPRSHTPWFTQTLVHSASAAHDHLAPLPQRVHMPLLTVPLCTLCLTMNCSPSLYSFSAHCPSVHSLLTLTLLTLLCLLPPCCAPAARYHPAVHRLLATTLLCTGCSLQPCCAPAAHLAYGTSIPAAVLQTEAVGQVQTLDQLPQELSQ